MVELNLVYIDMYIILCKEEFGRFPSFFSKAYRHELPTICIFTDSKGVINTVKVMFSIDYILIGDGWLDINVRYHISYGGWLILNT